MFFSKRKIFYCSILTIFFMFGPVRTSYGISQPKNLSNIVFITIDTLRADHLGCYGYKSIKTPTIDRLAKKGVLFSNAYSPIPLTFPSHVSIFTGQYPIQHGILNNVTFELQDSAKTLAEILKNLGHKTGAIVASYVLASHFGLNQGFDSYNDHFFENKEEMPDYSQNYRVAEDVTNTAKKWLKKNYQKPFFLWVHYFDPHTPYNPPSEFNQLSSSPYDGEIAYTDQCLGVLFEEMERLSLFENTCIVLVGDHGEGLWEHNEETHGLFIYNATLQIPLIMSYPRLFSKGKQINSLVRTVDIMPTILELLDIKSEKGHVQGTSLMPLLTGKKKDIELDLYCECRYSELNFNWAPLEGIVTSEGWKYIHAPKSELYNLKKDPHEKKNLLSSMPQKAKELHERLLSLRKDLLQKSHSYEVAKQIMPSPETRERIRSLGYAGFSGHTKETLDDQLNHQLPDPKDRVHLLVQIDRARSLEEKGEFDQAIQKYEKVLEEDPGNKMALFYAGMTYSKMNKPEEGLNKLNELEKLDPQNYDCKNSIGLLYDRLGIPQKAIKAYKEALQINSKIPYIHHNLGKIYLNLNDLDLAMQEFQHMRSLSQDPVVISMAIGNLGGIYARQGDLKEALTKFKESIRFNSTNRDAHISLAETYYHLGEISHSIDEWKTIINLWPDDYISYYKLAQLFLDVNKSVQAVQYLKKCIRLRPDYIDARILLQRINQELTFNRSE